MAVTIQSSSSDIFVGRETSGGGEVEEITCTSAGRALLAGTDAAAQRATLSVREKLTATRTYYIRTDGSDSNDGLSNTSGGAFLTVQKGIDTAASLDIGEYDVTIQIGDGTYTGANTLKRPVGSGDVIIQGNSGTPSNVDIHVTGGNCFTIIHQSGKFKIKDMKLRTTTSGRCIETQGSAVEIDNLDFGASASQHMLVWQAAYLEVVGDYAVSGGASQHVYASTGSWIRMNGTTITYSNSPNFTGQNFIAIACAVVSATSMTFTNGGTVTGQRYYANTNGVINTNGGGASYIPGDSSGSTATGGQYV